MRFHSLKQRFTILLLAPVALLLLAMGAAGFLFAKEIMLDGWRSTALFSLERAAHSINMRLTAPGEQAEMLASAGEGLSPAEMETWLLNSIKELPGVQKAHLAWQNPAPFPDLAPARSGITGAGRGRGMGGMGSWQGGMGGMFHRVKISKVGTPRLDAKSGRQTVVLSYDFQSQKGETVAVLTVQMGFAFLLQDLAALEWWKTQAAFLVDHDGRFLAHTTERFKDRARLGENRDEFELAVLKQIGARKAGTYLGPGHPPEEVAGFYPLASAPWTMVLFSPGEDVLAPIIRFRNWFVLAGLVASGLVLLLIMRVTGGVAQSLSKLSSAAAKVSKGDFSPRLQSVRADEIGRLVQDFNGMVEGLKERDYIRNTFGRYVDQNVARALLAGREAAQLGGEKRRVAVMMSDIRGFTALVQSMDPADTLAVINAYLSRLIEVIQMHQGVIVDFLGDAVLAFFDPTVGPAEPAVCRAVCCGLAMQRAVDQVNRENRAKGAPELHTAIAIHFDEVVVGNIGSTTRTKFGIVGAAVNQTHRMQAVAAGGETVLSQSVVDALGPRVKISRSYLAEMKGIPGQVKIFVAARVDNCELCRGGDCQKASEPLAREA